MTGLNQIVIKWWVFTGIISVNPFYFNIMLYFEVFLQYFELCQDFTVFRDYKSPAILCSNICECYKVFAAAVALCLYESADICDDQVTWV